MISFILHKAIFHINNDQGMAFITVLLVSTILSLGAAAYFVQSSQEAGIVRTRIDSTQAFYAAEAAVEWAKYQLRAPDWWDLNGWSEEISVPGEGGTVATTQLNFTYDGVKGTVTATGNFGAKQRRVMVEVAPDMSMSDPPAFAKAVCSCGALEITGNASTDSFKSSLGAYNTQTAGNGGHVGSNADIEVTGNASIQGGVEGMGFLAGDPNSQIAGEVTLGGDASSYQGSIGGTLTEAHNFTNDVCPCNLFDLGTAVTQAQANNDNNQIDPRYLRGANFSISGQNTITLTAGTYYLTDFEITGQAKVYIEGEVIIYLDTDATVEVSGNGLINGSENAANLRIYTNTTNHVEVTGNGDFSGLIYAPYAYDMELTGNGNIFGAIVGNTVQLSGNGDIHYDEDAAKKADLFSYAPTEVGVDVISWREVEL